MYFFSMEQNSLSDTFFNSAIHSDVQCPMHLHYSMEIVYVKKGELIMNVNGVDRVIRSGQATFISVFEPHSFFTPKSSVCIVTEFSPQLVSEFYSAVKAKRLVTEVFEIKGDFLRLLENLSDKSVSNILVVKAALYPLCFNLLNNCEFTNDGKEIDSIFIEAVKYIYDHYGDEKIEVEVIYDEYATGTYLVLTSTETEFIGLFGAPITKNDLNEGAIVEIVYGGQVMMSIPPQIVAKKIKVIN